MRINSRKLIEKLEQVVPQHLAESWDNVGFQLGNPDRVIDKVLCALEITHQVIDEAVDKCVDLIIVHHPLIFKGLKTITEDDPKSKLVLRLIRENINVYAMHTNFDHASGGLNDLMAQTMGLKRVEPLKEVYREALFKVAVFVPLDELETVKNAVFQAGGGRLGLYEGCGFVSQGLGLFTPLEGSNPALGQINKAQEVNEAKFEFMVCQGLVSQVVAAMLAAHPYEDVAYDLIQLKNKGQTESLGRVGYLDSPLSPQDFASHLKSQFNLESVKVCIPKDKAISKVALVSGAGMDYISEAARVKADAFVTGDVKYHEAQESQHYGIITYDIGHFESEVIFSRGMVSLLKELVEAQDYQVVIEASETERPIFKHF